MASPSGEDKRQALRSSPGDLTLNCGNAGKVERRRRAHTMQPQDRLEPRAAGSGTAFLVLSPRQSNISVSYSYTLLQNRVNHNALLTLRRPCLRQTCHPGNTYVHEVGQVSQCQGYGMGPSAPLPEYLPSLPNREVGCGHAHVPPPRVREEGS